MLELALVVALRRNRVRVIVVAARIAE